MLIRRISAILVLIAGISGLCGYGAEHHAKQIEQTVADGSSGAVAASIHGLKATVDGRDIEVSGLADGPAERDRILKALDTVQGRRVVRDKMTVLPAARPYTFVAEKSNRGITVFGYVPTEVAREEIAVMLNRDVSNLKLASGAPGGWTAVVQNGLSALSMLNKGALNISNQTLALSGEATTPSHGEAALAELKNLPAGYALKTSFSYVDDGETVKFELLHSGSDGTSVSGKLPVGLTPDGASQAGTTTAEQDVLTATSWLLRMDNAARDGQCCNGAKALQAARDVYFVTGSARLDARSLRAINAITALVKTCGQSGDLRLEVGGHTDSRGDAAFNMNLSRKRADAVAEALIAQGVPADKIAAAGYGDTKPIADNDTEDGRAVNRRVTMGLSQ